MIPTMNHPEIFNFSWSSRGLCPHSLAHPTFWYLRPNSLVLAALSPWILFEVFFPRRFDVTARGEWIDYEFSSAEYADEFAALNEVHVIRVR